MIGFINFCVAFFLYVTLMIKFHNPTKPENFRKHNINTTPNTNILLIEDFKQNISIKIENQKVSFLCISNTSLLTIMM